MKRIHRNIIRHSLGLDQCKRGGMAYRNHYALYPYSEGFALLTEMCGLRLMERGVFKPGDEIVFFRVTRKGVDEARYTHRVNGAELLGERRPDVQSPSGGDE
jgi:hypothetical protein